MSNNGSLLSALYFTRSTGAQANKKDVTFCDAITVGGYPSEQNILKIVRIEVCMSDRTDAAVIVGLKVTYKMRERPDMVTVLHGLETKYIAGVLVVDEKELLSGVTGRLKDLVNDPAKNRRHAFIEFALYNQETGRTEIRGPYGSNEHLGRSWGCYGPILALEGTVLEREGGPSEGLTTLGFTRLVQGMPELGILGQ